MKLFTSSWKFWIGILCIVSGLSEIFVEPIPALLCIAVGCLFIRSVIVYYKSSPEKLWSKWDKAEKSKQQLERLHRSRNGEVDPQYIYTDLKFGYFISSEKGKYRTTLLKCTCPDFKKRHVPCKHMYYLADQCGLIKIDSELLNTYNESSMQREYESEIESYDRLSQFIILYLKEHNGFAYQNELKKQLSSDDLKMFNKSISVLIYTKKITKTKAGKRILFTLVE